MVYYEFFSLLGSLAWLRVQCLVSGEKEDWLGCWCVEINQNILTNILAGFQFAWLFAAQSDSRMVSFRTDAKWNSSNMHSGKGAWSLSLHGWFWVKVEVRALKLSPLGACMSLDVMQGHTALCVCVLLTLFFLFLPLFLFSHSLPLKCCHRRQSRSRWVFVFAQLLWAFSLCWVVHGLSPSENLSQGQISKCLAFLKKKCLELTDWIGFEKLLKLKECDSHTYTIMSFWWIFVSESKKWQISMFLENILRCIQYAF